MTRGRRPRTTGENYPGKPRKTHRPRSPGQPASALFPVIPALRIQPGARRADVAETLNRTARRLFPVLCLLLLVPLPAAAQQFTDFQVTPGTGSKNNANTLIGQSFTTNAAANSIVSLDLYANNNGLAVGNFTLSLYAAAGSAGSYSPTGNALFSATYSNAVLGSVVGSNTVFSGLNWSVSGSTTYLIAFESSPTATVKWKAAAASETGNLLAGYTGQNR